MEKLLLAADLDRTVLPNGAQQEPTDAREKFTAFTKQDFVTLAYISGRGETLLKAAIAEYDIPLPAFAIGDVGTTIFVTHDNSWQPLPEWQEAIAKDWNGNTHTDLLQLLSDIPELTLQEDSKQNTYKLSYYTPVDTDRDALITKMEQRLQPAGVQAALIWSIDEAANIGLMDVLPKTATKLHALEFLMEHLGFSKDNTVFCGDSGNDMPALVSGLNAVLVGNARDEVKQEAQSKSANLYIAKGYYSVGVLEGVAHYVTPPPSHHS